ncbi:MAG TPA: hypothetical protein VEA99_07775 [Gemmatimonadaceae bacterium]|nr:hypothetical protein [Gemmatimonadaceae bacterium]
MRIADKLEQAARAARRIVAPSRCPEGHRHQHVENRLGARVQVCDACGREVGRELPAERRAGVRLG